MAGKGEEKEQISPQVRVVSSRLFALVGSILVADPPKKVATRT